MVKPSRSTIQTALRSSIVLVGLLLISTLGVAQNSTSRALTTAEIARRGIPNTVTIYALDATGDTISQGSGVVLRPTGVVVTNWHVLEGASSAVVQLSTGEAFRRVVLLEGDAALDLALIKIPAFGIPAAVASAELPDVGGRLVAIGSPLGLSRTVSEGIVSATRLVGGRRLLQMSTPISPGSSGGPVFDERGRVVAIATSYLEGGQQLNFAVPIRYALGLLELGSPPRELGSVFADASLQSRQSPVAAVAGRPTKNVRPNLSGSYSIVDVTEVHPPDGKPYNVRFTGKLFLAGDDMGLGEEKREDEPEDSTILYRVASHSTAPDGRVGLRWLGMDYAGYQTDAGFTVEGSSTLNDGKVLKSRLNASLSAPPLTESVGIYTAEVRTQYTSGTYRGDFTNWTGVILVEIARGMISIVLRLENASGGDVGLSNSAPLIDGNFSVPSPDGRKRLEGRLAGGRIYAKWTDRRDDGARFEGDLVGRRQ